MSSRVGAILVTGAGGFIGSHVVKDLLASGFEVTAHEGLPGMTGVPSPPGVSTWAGDLTEGIDRGRLAHVETIVHVAGLASVPESFDDPLGSFRSHALTTTAVLSSCRDLDVRRLVYVSSAEVYGAAGSRPVAETTPRRPVSPYGAAKLTAERMIEILAERVGIDAVILRPFSVYGPGQRPATLIGHLIEQVTEGHDPAPDDPRPVRDYVFVQDVAAAVRSAVVATLPGSVSVYNVASGLGVSAGDVARILASASGTRHHRQATTERPSEIFHLIGDPTAAERDLGWRATVGLEAGLRRTFDARGRL